MYTKLTKVVHVEGHECVACICYGTEMCRIHNGAMHCGECEVFAAILNQLHAFETILNEDLEDCK